MDMGAPTGMPIPTIRMKIQTPTSRTVMAEMIRGVPLPPSWTAQVSDLTAELSRELRAGHVLRGRNMRTLARSGRQDDVLFEDIDSGELWVVHLTWSRREKPPFPWATQIKDVTELADDSEDDEDEE